MTPATADRARRVGDQQHVGGELALDVVERLEPLPGASRGARRSWRRPSAPGVDRRRVERVDRLAELEHHVVRGVDDVRDRALAGGEEAHLDAVRRRADGHAAHPAADEPRAQVGVADVDGEALARRRARSPPRPRSRACGPARPVAARDLAREAQDRQRVAAVGLDVHVEHDVAVQVRRAGRPSGVSAGRIRMPSPSPVRRSSSPEHSIPLETTPIFSARSMRRLPGSTAPGQRDRDPLAGRDVGRAAHDRQRLAAVAEGHRRQATGGRRAGASRPSAARR